MVLSALPLPILLDDEDADWFTPRSIPNLALWLDASQGAKTGGAGQFTAANSEYLSIADNAALSTWAGDLPRAGLDG